MNDSLAIKHKPLTFQQGASQTIQNTNSLLHRILKEEFDYFNLVFYHLKRN